MLLSPLLPFEWRAKEHFTSQQHLQLLALPTPIAHLSLHASPELKHTFLAPVFLLNYLFVSFLASALKSFAQFY